MVATVKRSAEGNVVDHLTVSMKNVVAATIVQEEVKEMVNGDRPEPKGEE